MGGGERERERVLTADEDLDGARERGYRGRRRAEGEDLARGEGFLARFGVGEDGRVEEAGIEEGPFVAGGVGPGKVARRETSESSGLIVAG